MFPRGAREAERRQALGCGGTRLGAGPNVGPRVPARISFRSPRAGGRSPLGAPPRRFFGPEPAWRILRALHMSGALDSAWVHSHDPLVVADGRCCPGASREHGYEPCTQDAASRSNSGSSPETPSVSGTRLT